MTKSRMPVATLISLAAMAALVSSPACSSSDGAGEHSETGDAPLSAPVTVTFQNGAAPSASYAGTSDTSLAQATPTTNAGASASVQADMDTPSGSRQNTDAVLRFDLSSIPAGSVVQSVKLTVNVTSATSGQGYTLYALSRAWSESQATWTSAAAGAAWAIPGARGASDRAGAPLGTMLPTATGKYTVTLDAAGIAAVQGWVKSSSKNFGFVLDATSDMDGLVFDSSEATTAGARPALAVTYAPPAVNACDAAKAARAALVVGAYRPGASTTGPVPCVPLTRHDGTLTVTAANAVVEGLDIYGPVVLGSGAKNVTIRNCILRGPVSSSQELTLSGGGSNYDRLGLLVEDSRIDLTGRENWFRDGIDGSNFTMRRAEILRGVDGVGLMTMGGNVTVEASWIHDGAHFSWPPGTPGAPSHPDDQTHNDGIQFQRGSNYVVRGNFIGGDRGQGNGTGDDYNNACLMIGQSVDGTPANHLGSALIEKNWFQGGAASINLAYSFGNDLHELTIRNNRFLRGPGYYILKGKSTNATLSGNVFDDTGAPVTISPGK